VLIVTGIIGATTAIVRWPLPPPPPVPGIASDAPDLVDPPRTANPLPPLDVTGPGVTGRVLRPVDGAAATVAVVPEPASDDAPPIAADMAIPDTPVVSSLASRRLDTAPVVPVLGLPPLAEAAAAASTHGLVDRPAVAVARVVTVAGRGLRSGLRATTAVFRAAF
jgi:hypothetical protein